MSSKKLVSSEFTGAFAAFGREQSRIDELLNSGSAAASTSRALFESAALTESPALTMSKALSETGALSAINEMNDVLDPTRQAQIAAAKILRPHDVIETLFSSSQWMNTVSSNDAWETIYDNLKVSSSFAEKRPLWEEMLGFQNTILDLPDHISEALSGLNINQSSLGFLAAGIDPNRLDNIIDALNLDSILIDEYDIEDSEDDSDEDLEESPIILPGEFQERFELVNSLPVTLYKRVMGDPQLMRQIDPRDFEYFVAELIEKLGFENVDVTPQSNDGGRDILATRTINGIKMLFSFECKRYAESRKIGPNIMRSLIGTVNQKDTQTTMGVLVTTSSFTAKSKKIIASEAAIDGKDFNDLVDWIDQAKNK